MSLANFDTDAGRGMVVRKQPPNLYTALLLVSVVALAIGCLFLFLELQSYGLSVSVSSDAKVSSVPMPQPTSGAMMVPLEGSRFRVQGSGIENARIRLS